MGKRIRLVSEKDNELLLGIARTGFINEDLLKACGFPKTRFREHIKVGNVELKGNYMLYGCLTSIYQLSKKAKMRLRKEFFVVPYRNSLSQLEHSYCLAKIYWLLTPKERQTWITEDELKHKYKFDLTVDAMFLTKAGEKVGVEVITDTYTKEKIAKKEEFFKLYCDKKLIMHTHKDFIGGD